MVTHQLTAQTAHVHSTGGDKQEYRDEVEVVK